jgi:hypothetical protein
MGAAIALRNDYDGSDLRRLARVSLPQTTSGRRNGADHQGEVWI